MTIRSLFKHSAAAAVAATILLVHQAPVSAADCKGLEKNQCDSNGSCTWVDSYTRKDGVKVDGYCRKKGGKKSSSQSDS